MFYKKIFTITALLFFINILAEAQVSINNTGDQPNSSAMLDVSSTSKGILIPRMTEAQRNAISNPIEGLMIYQTNNEPGYYYYSVTSFPTGWKKVANGDETKIYGIYNIKVTGSGRIGDPYHITAGTHYIGEQFGGGTVFYVYDGGMHGLVASLDDISTSATWDNGNPVAKITGTVWDGSNPYQLGGSFLGGVMNTGLIIAGIIGDNPLGNFAARLCSDFYCVDNTDSYLYYGDWYLPTLFELNLMYQQKSVLGISGGEYWSSNEATDAYQAWVMNFGNNYNYTNQKNSTAKVRAIRSF